MGKHKTLILSFILISLLFAIPRPTSAQLLFPNEDAFYGGDGRNGLLDKKGSGSHQGIMGNQTFGLDLAENYSPLNSGMALLVVAGLGYALLKTKKRKGSQTLILAFALVTGFTQCKKESPENVTPTPIEGETRHINVALGFNDGNGKYQVKPNDIRDIAPVCFEVGDAIQVAYDGKFVGTLNCTMLTDEVDINGDKYGVFEGDITVTKNGDQPLYFYFFGNRSHGASVGDDRFTIDISDQTTGLPVISYAPSVQNYSDEVVSYTVQYNWLKNQCALVKFKTENIYDMSANTLDNNPDAIYTTDKDVTIYGLNNKVTVNLGGSGDAQFSWSVKDGSNGAIKLFRPVNTAAHPDSASTVRFAIIQHADYSGVTEGNLDVSFDPATDPYGFFGTYKIAHNVVKNEYYDGAKLDLVWHSGAFSISSTQQVVFSRGNLQYKRSDGTWRLAKHQYDWVGGYVASQFGHNDDLRQGNVVLQENVAGDTDYSYNEGVEGPPYNGWIDLFGWGTGDAPLMTSTNNLDYTSHKSFVDWGINNITNSGKPGANRGWQTITHEEFRYIIGQPLFSYRPDAEQKVGLATVDGIHGLVILPDLWNLSYPHGMWKPADNGANWSDNVFTIAQWNTMETGGAVFLPAAGRRNGTDYDGGEYANQNYGVYHESDKQGPDASYSIGFGYIVLEDHVNPQYATAPDNGHAVRLVYRL